MEVADKIHSLRTAKTKPFLFSSLVGNCAHTSGSVVLIFCISLRVRVISTDHHSVPLSLSISSARRNLCFSKAPLKRLILASLTLGQGRQSRHHQGRERS